MSLEVIVKINYNNTTVSKSKNKNKNSCSHTMQAINPYIGIDQVLLFICTQIWPQPVGR